MKTVSRRDFVKTGTMATLGMSVFPKAANTFMPANKTVRIGVIGTGNRGTGHVNTLLTIDGVEVVAVCDIVESKAENAASKCVNAGRKRPKIYSKNESSYMQMLDKEKLDAVIIATFWNSHTTIALHAMKNRIYPGIEVPAALTIDDTWRLVETSQKTGIPCMMLENWSFRQDNLALLNMKRLGMFGDILQESGIQNTPIAATIDLNYNPPWNWLGNGGRGVWKGVWRKDRRSDISGTLGSPGTSPVSTVRHDKEKPGNK